MATYKKVNGTSIAQSIGYYNTYNSTASSEAYSNFNEKRYLAELAERIFINSSSVENANAFDCARNAVKNSKIFWSVLSENDGYQEAVASVNNAVDYGVKLDTLTYTLAYAINDSLAYTLNNAIERNTNYGSYGITSISSYLYNIASSLDSIKSSSSTADSINNLAYTINEASSYLCESVDTGFAYTASAINEGLDSQSYNYIIEALKDISYNIQQSYIKAEEYNNLPTYAFIPTNLYKLSTYGSPYIYQTISQTYDVISADITLNKKYKGTKAEVETATEELITYVKNKYSYTATYNASTYTYSIVLPDNAYFTTLHSPISDDDTNYISDMWGSLVTLTYTYTYYVTNAEGELVYTGTGNSDNMIEDYDGTEAADDSDTKEDIIYDPTKDDDDDDSSEESEEKIEEAKLYQYVVRSKTATLNDIIDNYDIYAAKLTKALNSEYKYVKADEDALADILELNTVPDNYFAIFDTTADEESTATFIITVKTTIDNNVSTYTYTVTTGDTDIKQFKKDEIAIKNAIYTNYSTENEIRYIPDITKSLETDELLIEDYDKTLQVEFYNNIMSTVGQTYYTLNDVYNFGTKDNPIYYDKDSIVFQLNGKNYDAQENADFTVDEDRIIHKVNDKLQFAVSSSEVDNTVKIGDIRNAGEDMRGKYTVTAKYKYLGYYLKRKNTYTYADTFDQLSADAKVILADERLAKYKSAQIIDTSEYMSWTAYDNKLKEVIKDILSGYVDSDGNYIYDIRYKHVYKLGSTYNVKDSYVKYEFYVCFADASLENKMLTQVNNQYKNGSMQMFEKYIGCTGFTSYAASLNTFDEDDIQSILATYMWGGSNGYYTSNSFAEYHDITATNDRALNAFENAIGSKYPVLDEDGNIIKDSVTSSDTKTVHQMTRCKYKLTSVPHTYVEEYLFNSDTGEMAYKTHTSYTYTITLNPSITLTDKTGKTCTLADLYNLYKLSLRDIVEKEYLSLVTIGSNDIVDSWQSFINNSTLSNIKVIVAENDNYINNTYYKYIIFKHYLSADDIDAILSKYVDDQQQIIDDEGKEENALVFDMKYILYRDFTSWYSLYGDDADKYGETDPPVLELEEEEEEEESLLGASAQPATPAPSLTTKYKFVFYIQRTPYVNKTGADTAAADILAELQTCHTTSDITAKTAELILRYDSVYKIENIVTEEQEGSLTYKYYISDGSTLYYMTDTEFTLVDNDLMAEWYDNMSDTGTGRYYIQCYKQLILNGKVII